MPAARRVIGVDESGKGDFFGPLVVAAVLASDDELTALRDIGVRDGKLIADKKLLTIDNQLRRGYPHAVIILRPEQYNRQYAAVKNLNKLLATNHARAITAVLSDHKADLAVSDKFGKSELVEHALLKLGTAIPLTQIVRGEAVLQVAAASIIARAAFLRDMKRLSIAAGVALPKGAGAPVDRVGQTIAARHPLSIFNSIAKTHFKNYQRILKPGLLAD